MGVWGIWGHTPGSPFWGCGPRITLLGPVAGRPCNPYSRPIYRAAWAYMGLYGPIWALGGPFYGVASRNAYIWALGPWGSGRSQKGSFWPLLGPLLEGVPKGGFHVEYPGIPFWEAL